MSVVDHRLYSICVRNRTEHNTTNKKNASDTNLWKCHLILFAHIRTANKQHSRTSPPERNQYMPTPHLTVSFERYDLRVPYTVCVLRIQSPCCSRAALAAPFQPNSTAWGSACTMNCVLRLMPATDWSSEPSDARPPVDTSTASSSCRRRARLGNYMDTHADTGKYENKMNQANYKTRLQQTTPH